MFLDQLEPEPAAPSHDSQEPATVAMPNQQLPTMADLTALEDELNVIDTTLAELQD